MRKKKGLDYYPFGLEIPGLSTQAFKPKYDQNRYRYNGIEYDSAFGFNDDEAHYRDLDPAIGRWAQIDPKIEGSESISPYASMGNNPILKSDPLGDEEENCCGGLKQWVSDHVDNFKNNLKVLAYNASERISSAVDQAGTNFNARWEARADPIHQAIDNPFSMIGGVVGTEINAAETVVKTEIKTTIQESKAATTEIKVGDYSNLKDGPSVGPGKNFTSDQKKAIIAENMKKNDGIIKSDKSGTVADRAVQSKKGVPANMNQAEIDHITPKSKGGTNSYSNAQVLTKKENLNKSDK